MFIFLKRMTSTYQDDKVHFDYDSDHWDAYGSNKWRQEGSQNPPDVKLCMHKEFEADPFQEQINVHLFDAGNDSADKLASDYQGIMSRDWNASLINQTVGNTFQSYYAVSQFYTFQYQNLGTMKTKTVISKVGLQGIRMTLIALQSTFDSREKDFDSLTGSLNFGVKSQ